MPSNPERFTLGEIQLFAGSFTPEEWQPCAGQTLQINSNFSLFQILGNRYGGDGQSTFQLPNLAPVACAAAGTPPLRYYICVTGQFPNGGGMN